MVVTIRLPDSDASKLSAALSKFVCGEFVVDARTEEVCRDIIDAISEKFSENDDIESYVDVNDFDMQFVKKSN